MVDVSRKAAKAAEKVEQKVHDMKEERRRAALREELQEEIEQLKSRLEELAENKSSAAMDALRQGVARVQQQAARFLESDVAERYRINEAMDRGEEVYHQVREEIKARPVRSALLALGVGALVGMLLRRD